MSDFVKFNSSPIRNPAEYKVNIIVLCFRLSMLFIILCVSSSLSTVGNPFSLKGRCDSYIRKFIQLQYLLVIELYSIDNRVLQ